MAQEFAGLPERVVVQQPLRTRSPVLNLYLPECVQHVELFRSTPFDHVRDRHHHVESVHFMSPRGDELHPAVAVVQTPHREYFVLRDNGMQIGCEEEGVAVVWQEILQCDDKGLQT